MANSWADAAAKSIRLSFRELKNGLAPLPDTKISALRKCKREATEIIQDMADHVDFVNDFLQRTHKLLIGGAKGEEVSKEVCQQLVRELDNYLSTPIGYIDPEDNWPDTPATTNGACWVCGNDGNVRWLADPIKKEPRDREPWCKRCYKTQQKKSRPE